MAKREDFIEFINKKDPKGLNSVGEPYKVLVVDDSTAMRKMIIQILKSEAFDIIEEASNGQRAVELYKEHRPDLVTMDIHMPVMDGVTALTEILAFDGSARVIMLTSDSEQSIVVDAIKKGAKGYIIKPPERGTVIEKVAAALK